MKPYWLKLVWLNLAEGLLLMLPLASVSAFDSFDTYGTPDWASPDPGSYWQGSSAAQEYRSRSYSSPEYTAPGYTSPGYTAPGYSSPKYNAPDYTPYADQDRSQFETDRHDSDEDSDWYGSDWSSEQVGADWRRDEGLPAQGARPATQWRSDPGRRSSGESDDWRARRQTPSYRFREAPQLDRGDIVGGNDGYRFRPLSAKELERKRETGTASGFRPWRQDRRQLGTYAPGGDAYGSEPNEVPGGFYRRYYRTDD